jgi:hypothetical protein
LRFRRTMSLRSAADEAFLNSLESWLDGHGEVLILIRYSRAAGNKDFEFHTSFPSLRERLRQLPSETCITAFRTPQLQLRGIVDDAFIHKCLSSVPEGSEYAVVEMVRTTRGRFSSSDFSAGESHHQLRKDLEVRRGKPVAVGTYPPWQDETSDVISAYVPDQDGNLRRGIY